VDQKSVRTEEARVRPNKCGSAEHKLSPFQLRFAHMQGNTLGTNPIMWFNVGLIRELPGTSLGSMGPPSN
jgi:hypothetical protein